MKFRLPGFEVRLGREADPASSAPLIPEKPGQTPVPLSAIVSGLAEGLLAVDARQRILLCNESLAPLLNRPPRQALGLPLWETLRHREIGDMVERVLRTGAEDRRDIAFSLPAETVWEVRARAFAHGSARGAVLAFSDITHLRRLELLRKDFVANVSHELKTPLTALRAALETLLEGALEDPRHARDFLRTAEEQVERLQRLIDDLLTLARLEREAVNPPAAAVPAAAGLQTVAEAVLATLRPVALKTGVSLENALPPGEIRLALSADELTQVLLNLMDNGVKFNRPGGRVTLSAQAQGSSAEIAVADTGAGVPPEDQPRVFERFYRVDKARGRELGGTGLGLSIVKHLLENRGGTVRLESRPGQGSTFFVTLPLAS